MTQSSQTQLNYWGQCTSSWLNYLIFVLELIMFVKKCQTHALMCPNTKTDCNLWAQTLTFHPDTREELRHHPPLLVSLRLWIALHCPTPEQSPSVIEVLQVLNKAYTYTQNSQTETQMLSSLHIWTSSSWWVLTVRQLASGHEKEAGKNQ